MGLGLNSTLLSHLFDNQLIASRSFGLYMGTGYEQSNGVVNGSLTLGGYDSGRFEGDVYNHTIAQPHAAAANSPFLVSVQQMTLTDQSGGNQTDLLISAFDAYITTSQYHLNLPANVLQEFSSATGATPSNDELSVLRLPGNFNSKLTITLASGLTVTYDADWLRNVSNNSPISTIAMKDDSTNGTINLLGSAFLTSVYFMVNYDSTPPAFHLANALPHGPYVMTENLCANTVPIAAVQHSISSFAASGLTGAILGGVIGGLGLSFTIFWLLRKYLQRRQWRNQARHNMKGKGLDSESSFGGAKGKGSPSTLDTDRERGNSSEMATFAFDFNSQQHQSYANYLNAASQPGHQQKQQAISRTYSQFVKQISRENVAASRENLTEGAAPHGNTPPPSEQRQALYSQSQPQSHDIVPRTEAAYVPIAKR